MVRQQDSNNSIQLFPYFTGSTSRNQSFSVSVGELTWL
jgi:hypothetical protein